MTLRKLTTTEQLRKGDLIYLVSADKWSSFGFLGDVAILPRSREDIISYSSRSAGEVPLNQVLILRPIPNGDLEVLAGKDIYKILVQLPQQTP